ncbi:hypothetical protein B0H66DRAFT_255434 [Apodospora peruviana]|uniref:Uncharacterized protein n=1 Tax=Apodospora peruviana TaxID=516989 RepID=A0AAE0I5K1_9PEZI|nr:hypothetical protein B0H66DRAFT_255434 [Apodospora peruviana]
MIIFHCVFGITLPPSDANSSFSLNTRAFARDVKKEALKSKCREITHIWNKEELAKKSIEALGQVPKIDPTRFHGTPPRSCAPPSMAFSTSSSIRRRLAAPARSRRKRPRFECAHEKCGAREGKTFDEYERRKQRCRTRRPPRARWKAQPYWLSVLGLCPDRGYRFIDLIDNLIGQRRSHRRAYPAAHDSFSRDEALHGSTEHGKHLKGARSNASSCCEPLRRAVICTTENDSDKPEAYVVLSSDNVPLDLLFGHPLLKEPNLNRIASYRDTLRVDIPEAETFPQSGRTGRRRGGMSVWVQRRWDASRRRHSRLLEEAVVDVVNMISFKESVSWRSTGVRKNYIKVTHVL